MLNLLKQVTTKINSIGDGSMEKKSSNRGIKFFLFIFGSIFLSNVIAALIGIPNGKQFVSIHNLQYNIIWIIISTILFFALKLHKD